MKQLHSVLGINFDLTDFLTQTANNKSKNIEKEK